MTRSKGTKESNILWPLIHHSLQPRCHDSFVQLNTLSSEGHATMEGNRLGTHVFSYIKYKIYIYIQIHIRILCVCTACVVDDTYVKSKHTRLLYNDYNCCPCHIIIHIGHPSCLLSNCHLHLGRNLRWCYWRYDREKEPPTTWVDYKSG